MNTYEQSMREQAERVRRELKRETQPVAPKASSVTNKEFIPSDVASPIYGYSRPKPSSTKTEGEVVFDTQETRQEEMERSGEGGSTGSEALVENEAIGETLVDITAQDGSLSALFLDPKHLDATSSQREAKQVAPPTTSISFQATVPPVNVVMTPRDRMAMARRQRLQKKENNL